MDWIERTIDSKNTEFIIAAILLLVLGLIRVSEKERIGVFIRSFLNPTLINQQLRQERAFNRIAVPLFFTIILILSFFLALTSQHFNMLSDASFTKLFLVLTTILLALTLVRGTIYNMLGKLFNLKHILQVHTTYWLLNNFILALIIFPLSILISFGPELLTNTIIIVGLTLLGIFYLLRSIRLFNIARQEIHVPLVYNVLYLCALEILPPILIAVAILRQAG